MKKLIITLVILFAANHLFAQYLHYWDNSKRERYVQPTEQAPPPPPQAPAQPKPDVAPAPLPLTNPVKLDVPDLVSSTFVPFNTVTGPPKFDRPPMVFHEWPDKCPGLSGAVPVLLNYVPAEIVVIVSEKYKGHLYSICTNKGANNKPEYKLKVCKNGMIVYEYANYKGEIMADREEYFTQ